LHFYFYYYYTLLAGEKLSQRLFLDLGFFFTVLFPPLLFPCFERAFYHESELSDIRAPFFFFFFLWGLDSFPSLSPYSWRFFVLFSSAPSVRPFELCFSLMS
jgi:hypothetical protein